MSADATLGWELAFAGEVIETVAVIADLDARKVEQEPLDIVCFECAREGLKIFGQS